MQNKKIAELLHQYFELGVAEGREGRNHDTKAGDALELPKDHQRLVDANTVKRFTDEMRGRLDRLDELAGG